MNEPVVTPGEISPARADDWRATAAGLDWFGALLILKISIAAAAVPLLIVGVVMRYDSVFPIQLYALPIGGALASAGMVAALIACRRVPDPPDPRASFTAAAVLVAACVAADVYLVTERVVEPLAAAISSLGHLFAYLVFLRAVARIGERLGAVDLTRRARLSGWLAIGGGGSATIVGTLLVGDIADGTADGTDLALWLVTPMVVAGVVFAALLPCAMLSRELARLLRRRLVAPPRAS